MQEKMVLLQLNERAHHTLFSVAAKVEDGLRFVTFSANHRQADMHHQIKYAKAHQLLKPSEAAEGNLAQCDSVSFGCDSTPEKDSEQIIVYACAKSGYFNRCTEQNVLSVKKNTDGSQLLLTNAS